MPPISVGIGVGRRSIRPVILRHAPGLAASPRVRYMLEVAGRRLPVRLSRGRTGPLRSGGAARTAAPWARADLPRPTDAAAERGVLRPLQRSRLEHRAPCRARRGAAAASTSSRRAAALPNDDRLSAFRSRCSATSRRDDTPYKLRTLADDTVRRRAARKGSAVCLAGRGADPSPSLGMTR